MFFESAGEIVGGACVVAAIPLTSEYVDAPIIRHGVHCCEMVEPRGLEPLTSTLPVLRSPN